MCVCLEVTLRGVPMEMGVQLGLGEGPIKSESPMSQPLGTIDTASLMLDHIHAHMCVSEPTLI